MQAAKASSSSSPPSLSCQRCSQPLQLDESLSDEALLASAASSSSNEGALTTSNYDVISSLVTAPSSTDKGETKQSTPLKHVKDAELREAVLQHHQREHRPTKDDSRSTSRSGAAPNSLTARLSLHSRLFDLVSSFVPAGTTATVPPASSSSSASSSSHQHPATSGATATAAAAAAAAAAGPRSFPLGIDHPLCLDCSDYCLEVIRRQVEEVRKERDALGEFNRELERSTAGNHRPAEGEGKGRRRIDGEAEVARLEAEIGELQTAVDQAVAALYKSERTRKDLEEELRQLEVEERELEADEADFWAGHSKLLSETTALESTKSSLQRSLQVSETTLARLNSTNVFYDAFCIGHEGGGGPSSSASSNRKRASGTGLATINGLRFGKMSSSSSGGGATSVEWNEVNAAWGQVALLVEVLRGRIGGMLEGQTARGNLSTPGRKGREFVGWRVRPKGSTSAMEKLAYSGQHPSASSSASPSGHQSEDIYELYHPGPWAGVTRMLHSRRFDAAMIGILDCTSQLFQWAEKISAAGPSSTNSSGAGASAEIPSDPPRMIHAINGEKIGDTSIRLAGAFFASEETWSRATKYLLVNLQVLMHWATRNETVPVPAPTQP